jgi:hypothetical protein
LAKAGSVAARRAALDCIGGRDYRRQRSYSTAINSAASVA